MASILGQDSCLLEENILVTVNVPVRNDISKVEVKLRSLLSVLTCSVRNINHHSSLQCQKTRKQCQHGDQQFGSTPAQTRAQTLILIKLVLNPTKRNEGSLRCINCAAFMLFFIQITQCILTNSFPFRHAVLRNTL